MKLRFLIFILWSLAANLHAADLFVQIQRGEKVTLGIPHFISKSLSAETLKRELEETVLEDILFNQIFSVTQEGPASEPSKIDFAGWGASGADLLIQANVHLKEDKAKGEEPKLELIASVYEVSTGKPIFQKLYRSAPKNGRRVAHEFVADLLYKLTGDKGVAKSKITFCNDNSGHKEIYIADYDGYNVKQITFDRKIALLPNWSPSGNEIIYTTYRRNNPDLYLFSLEKGTSYSFSARAGLNLAGSFSPDGNEIVATLSYQGSPNLYILNRAGEVVRRLTQEKFVDTSASFSPDGRKIAFISDRSGTPQVYIMDADGANLVRLTTSGYCDSPIWSPKGNKIAYSQGTEEGKHNIILHDIATGQRLKITEGVNNNENPSFSPDGKFLLFSSNRNSKWELFIASLDGRVHRKLLEFPGNSITPQWGH